MAELCCGLIFTWIKVHLGRRRVSVRSCMRGLIPLLRFNTHVSPSLLSSTSDSKSFYPIQQRAERIGLYDSTIPDYYYYYGIEKNKNGDCRLEHC
jgi:hypothetical protein